MPNKLSDIDVLFVSLVHKGANQRQIIWKSARATEETTELRRITFKKIDDDKQMVYGIVYAPEEVDTDGDFATAEEIEKAAYNFMKHRRTDKVDQQHDYNPDEGFVAESWILKENDPVFPEETVGAWAVGIKVENPETWALVKSGEIAGLSMAGEAKRTEVEKTEEPGLFSRVAQFFQNIRKDFNSQYGSDRIYEAMDALYFSLWETLDNPELTGSDNRSALEKNFEQFLTALNEDTKILKSDEEDDMKKEEVEQLFEEKLQSITDRLETLEKGQEDSDEDGDQEPLTKENIEDTLDEKLKPVTDRIEALEKSTNGSVKKTGQDEDEKESKGIPFV